MLFLVRRFSIPLLRSAQHAREHSEAAISEHTKAHTSTNTATAVTWEEEGDVFSATGCDHLNCGL